MGLCGVVWVGGVGMGMVDQGGLGRLGNLCIPYILLRIIIIVTTDALTAWADIYTASCLQCKATLMTTFGRNFLCIQIYITRYKDYKHLFLFKQLLAPTHGFDYKRSQQWWGEGLLFLIHVNNVSLWLHDTVRLVLGSIPKWKK